MWSKRFLWVGISSSIIAAVIAHLGISLLLYLVLPTPRYGSPHSPLSLVSFGSVGYLVYPVCWYYLIFRQRTYSVAQTTILLTYAFLIGCGLVVVWLFCTGVWFAFVPPPHSIHHPVAVPPIGNFLTLTFGMMIAGIALSFMVLIPYIPYILTGLPIAYLQRYFLLRLLKPADR